jgi:integrase
MSAQHLGVIWERVRKAAGVQGATPHSVRHTIASRHIAEAPAAVAAYLGHDPVVMLRTYSHPSLQQTAFIAEAADRIAAQTPS